MASRVANFDVWWAANPEIHKLVTPIPHSKKWVILRCRCEKLVKVQNQTRIQTIDYKAKMCLTGKYAGNIYNDDENIDLQLKFSGLGLLVRPVQLVASVAYHLLGIGVTRAVIEGLIKHKSIKEIAKKALQSIADIYRSAYYCTLVWGAAAAAALAGPVYHPFYYECRAFTGEKQSLLHRGHRTVWCLSPCMYRLFNITFPEKEKQDLEPGVLYGTSNRTLIALMNLAARKPLN